MLGIGATTGGLPLQNTISITGLKNRFLLSFVSPLSLKKRSPSPFSLNSHSDIIPNIRPSQTKSDRLVNYQN
jgi:hypothetical protein